MLGHRTLSVALIGALAVAACGADDGTTGGVERAEVVAAPSSSGASSSTTAPTTTSTDTPPPSTTTTPAPAPAATLAKAAPAISPEEMASRIADGERAVRDPATPPDVVAARAFELQQLYRQLARMPDWVQVVNHFLPDELRTTMQHNVSARNEFRAMHRTLSDTLPAWRIIDPPPAEELLGYYQEGEATFGVPWQVLAAVNLVETGMGRIRGTSVAGAQGPMQFMPATWAAFGAGGDVDDFGDAIMGAARYLAHNGGGSGNIDSALWNYNHSHKYVAGVKHYAAVMTDDPAAFQAYYHWQVVYLSDHGDVWMPTGYERNDRIPVADYVAANPEHHLGTATN